MTKAVFLALILVSTAGRAEESWPTRVFMPASEMRVEPNVEKPRNIAYGFGAEIPKPKNFGDALFVTAIFDGIASGEASVKVTGPGMTGAPLPAVAAGTSGLDRMWRECRGLVKRRGTAPNPVGDCRFPIPAAGDGGMYKVEAIVDGKPVAEENIELLRMPVRVGVSQLVANPTREVLRPYLHTEGLYIWVPNDVRGNYRTISFVYFQGGNIVEAVSTTVGYPSVTKDPIVEAIDVLESRPVEFGDTRVVVILDGKVQGKYRYDIEKDGYKYTDGSTQSPVVKVSGIKGFTTPKDNLREHLKGYLEDATDVTPAMEAAALERTKKDHVPASSLDNFSEGVICGILTDAKIEKQFHEYEAQARIDAGLSGESMRADDALKNRYLSHSQTEKYLKEKKDADNAGAFMSVKVRKLRLALEAVGKKFPAGCFKKLVPASARDRLL